MLFLQSMNETIFRHKRGNSDIGNLKVNEKTATFLGHVRLSVVIYYLVLQF